MKILVTGAAGFLGSNLSEYLLNKDHEVVAIDNFNDFYNPKIKEYNIKDFKDHEKFTLYRIDLLDEPALEDVFEKEKIEAIIHMAAWAGVTRSIKEPAVYVRNNEEATVNVAEMAVTHKVKNFIFASTSSIYGKKNSTPYEETMSTDYPLAPYPATKKGSEVMLSTYNLNHSLNVTILRIFNPVAPRLRPDLALPILIRSCLYDNWTFKQYWKDATRTSRDYTYALHIFDAISKILEKPFEYEIFNMGNSQPVTLKGLIGAVKDVVGKEPKVEIMSNRQGEMITTYANIDKAKEILGYNPDTTLKECVKIYYDWFLKQEDWYKKGEF